ncbi:FG-GAP-like repeat-containing protein [Streptomyces sp. NBC_01443]|uniref:FG-GAP-like repeat-containing protein n=1 Tax=Streptomyces sp. NBC_01443 TaxID=2903868 RepID=UPI002256E125|nr:FG-GAP-like repeat-containing protein [Streptomyces sp. NBC_01443]MCX4632944.1 RICIN domain-containing protein [Streptomyces sp. NBC_01443]
MPVPIEELKLEIVNAATGKPLGAEAAPSADGVLVVRDFPDGSPSPEQWQLAPVQAAEGEEAEHHQAYVIRNAVSGQVLDDPAAADRGVRQWDAADGNQRQQWHVVPVEGEAGLYFIEGATDGTVLDLDEPGADDTRIVLREHDDSAESQRWRFVPAEPERTSDPVLRWAALGHWNGRRSWRLAHSAALRPAPDATPSFSNMLLVLEQFGSDQDAGEWKSEGATRSPGGQPGWWGGAGARFLADTTGARRADIVGLKPAEGAVTSSGTGDGTFDDEERVLHPPVPSASPEDLWTLADTTGGGKPDVVVLAADGVRVSPQDEDGTFAPAGGEPALKAFGHGEQAGGWLADKHPRFLADTTGDGRLDVVGCHDDGVWVSLQDEEGAFADPLYVLDDFGVDQGWGSVEEHPRFLLRTTGGGAPDIVGFGPLGVVVSRGCGDGTFEPSKLLLNDFGIAQGWTSGKHLRFLADVTGDGNPDIVGFGNEGVWVSHSRGDGHFERAQLVCRGFGYNEDAGGWRVDRHPRFLADITGDGRVDIVGFGGPGVYVARNLFRRFRTR